METVLKRVKIKTTESRLETITPSSKQGVISKSLRRETASQPSLSLQIAILDDRDTEGRVSLQMHFCTFVAEATYGSFLLVVPVKNKRCKDPELYSRDFQRIEFANFVNFGICPNGRMALAVLYQSVTIVVAV